MNGSFTINKKIKVGFLASSFANRFGSGTAKHFEAVAKIFCADYEGKIEVVFFCNNLEQIIYLENEPIFSNAKIVSFPNVRGKWLRSSRQYFKYAMSQKSFIVDVLHFSVPRFYPFFWLFPAKKFVCTFHAGGDVTSFKEKFILSREIYNITAKIFYGKLNLIIAVSEHGRKEISEVYRIPSNSISVMHPGTDDIWHLTTKNKIIAETPGKKLILIIGRWQHYKNVQMVSKALANSGLDDLSSFYFVFIGKKISSNAELIESDLSKVDRNSFKTIDYLDDNSYADLIKQAELIVVPSLNEGFSHPIFDAHSLGKRVLLHSPSPAAEILKGRQGVFAADLSNSDNFLSLVNDAINQDTGVAIDNQNFLKSIGATWKGITENYYISYKKLLDVSNV